MEKEEKTKKKKVNTCKKKNKSVRRSHFWKEVSFQKIILARKRTPPVRDVGAQREVEFPDNCARLFIQCTV